MTKERFQGVLTQKGEKTFLLGTDGKHLLESDFIWSGYIHHWLGRKVYARHLPQRDYERGNPIVIMWPHTSEPGKPYVDLCFNMRLPKYTASLFGHIAINVNGEVYNFSHHLNENEIMTTEEYYYRPPLGEFAPNPKTGLYDAGETGRPYYDKFGRLFMRTVHVLRIEGLETNRLSRIYHHELEKVHAAPKNPRKPEEYTGFNIFTRSCTTIIRDGLRKCGFTKVRGILPRDFFACAAYYFHTLEETGTVETKILKLKQLKVPEAPYSKKVPLSNPINWVRQRRLIRMRGMDDGAESPGYRVPST
jgi:hypothetical protein